MLINQLLLFIIIKYFIKYFNMLQYTKLRKYCNFGPNILIVPAQEVKPGA